MGKRYVFWRMPTGKPYKGDDDKFAPTALLSRIGQAASVTPEGTISFPLARVRFMDELVVQAAAVVLDPSGDELNDADASSIMWEAIASEIKNAGGGKAICPKNVLLAADTLAAAHFRKPAAEYVLVTTLSVERLPANALRLNDCEILPLKGRGTRYPLPEPLKRWADDSPMVQHLTSTKYQTIKVRAGGRTVCEATDKSLHAINLLRGLWTLFATFGSWKRHFAGMPKREPIGVIRTGPIHTLHGLDGKPVKDIYWYEPDYTKDGPLFAPKDGWGSIEKNRRRTARRMRHHPCRRDLEELIVRYAIALDNADLSVAFLQMWSILEKITDTVGANYDETIRRTTWLFQDRDTHKELLEHLRFRRNWYVHAAKSGEQADQVAYLVKSFVDPHLLQLISNDFKVESLSEYGEFLSLPRNVDTLTKRRNALQRAIGIWKQS